MSSLKRRRLRVIAVATAMLVLVSAGVGVALLMRTAGSGLRTTAADDPIAILGAIDTCAAEFYGQNPASATASGSSDAAATCLDEVVVGAVRKLGPEAAFNRVSDLLPTYPRLYGDCHWSAHKAGQWYLKLKQNVPDALRNAPETCMGGFIHGVLDTWGTQSPDQAQFTAALGSCALLPEYGEGACADGVGHQAWLNGSGSFAGAAALCAGSPSSDLLRQCLGGVVMQQQVTEYPIASLEPQLAALVAQCSALPQRMFVPCQSAMPYLYAKVYLQPGRLGGRISREEAFELVSQGIPKYGAYCLSITDSESRSHCYSYASVAITQEMLGEAEDAERLCDLFGSAGARDCRKAIDSDVRQLKGASSWDQADPSR